MRHDDEWELILQCRRGEEGAYKPLVLRYQEAALRTAEGFLIDPDEAADAVQDAFVRAYRRLDRLREGSRFGPWFRTILRNLCLDRLKSPRSRQTELVPERLDRRHWSEPEAQRHLERAELSQFVRDALAHLSDDHRRVLVLKEIEELGYAAIAEELGIPPGTVASRLYHARAALRRVIEEMGVSMEEMIQ